jgi:hypothetical protein
MKTRILLLCALVVASVLVLALYRLPKPVKAFRRPAASNEAYLLRVREGVGTEVRLARQGAAPGETVASVESVRSFIAGRSGLQLDDDNAARLAVMEESALNTPSGRIGAGELTRTLSKVLSNRIRNCSDAEIQQATDALSNVKIVKPAPGSSARAGDPAGVMLRRDGHGSMKCEKFAALAADFRSRFQAPSLAVATMAMIDSVVAEAAHTRIQVLSQALPDQWGDVPERGLTPVQAFIVTYALGADDDLSMSAAALRAEMKWLEGEHRKQITNYPASEGRVPFGDKGYLFSSPVALLLNHATTAELLDLISQRLSAANLEVLK